MKKILLGIVENEGKHLIVSRKDISEGLVHVFPGGKQEATDLSEQGGIEREVEEETGVQCTAIKKFGERVHPKTGRTIAYWLCKAISSEIIIAHDHCEVSSGQWVSNEELFALLGEDIFDPVKKYLLRDN